MDKTEALMTGRIPLTQQNERSRENLKEETKKQFATTGPMNSARLVNTQSISIRQPKPLLRNTLLPKLSENNNPIKSFMARRYNSRNSSPVRPKNSKFTSDNSKERTQISKERSQVTQRDSSIRIKERSQKKIFIREPSPVVKLPRDTSPRMKYKSSPKVPKIKLVSKTSLKPFQNDLKLKKQKNQSLINSYRF